MAAAARELKFEVILPPYTLGKVGRRNVDVSRAGIDGNAVQLLGKSGSRQSITGLIFFEFVKDADAAALSIPLNLEGREVRIKDDVNGFSFQGIIHTVTPVGVTAIVNSNPRRNNRWQLKLEVDFTRTV